MHPDNPYASAQPDFAALAETSLELRPHIFVNAQNVSVIDFKKPEAVRALTRALLSKDFSLDVSIPDDRLCPTVANRLDYLVWIKQNFVHVMPNQPISGMDVGTGSTAIYPLLGCRNFKNWSFIATEIDPNSFHHASGNVSRNALSDRIHLVKTTSSDRILELLHASSDTVVDFVMCNPPFYSSHEEVAQLASQKAFDPHAVCSGADNEMITEGGEVAFVKRIVEESLVLKQRCKWYTSLLGRLSSVGEVVAFLREKEIMNYVLAEFIQGHTKRWAVGWSYSIFLLPDSEWTRPPSKALHLLLPPSNTRTHIFPTLPFKILDRLVTRSASSLKGLSVQPQVYFRGRAEFQINATFHSWSRGARRGTATSTAQLRFSEDDPWLSTNVVLRERTEAEGASAEEGEEKGSVLEMHLVDCAGGDEVRRVAWEGLTGYWGKMGNEEMKSYMAS